MRNSEIKYANAGDFVKGVRFQSICHPEINVMGLVENFDNRLFVYYGGWMALDKFDNYEIIGNIMQNPELIGKIFCIYSEWDLMK